MFHDLASTEIRVLVDNPVNNKGVSIGYNSVNSDVYFTFLQQDFYDPKQERRPDYSNDYTICFNENIDAFTSFYSYMPAWYINKGSKMITTNHNSTELWEHFKGEKADFYGIKYGSEIKFNVNPGQGDGEYTFNNLSYKMEMKLKP